MYHQLNWSGLTWLAVPILALGLCVYLLRDSTLNLWASRRENSPPRRLRLIRGRRLRELLAFGGFLFLLANLAIAPFCENLFPTVVRIASRNWLVEGATIAFAAARISEAIDVCWNRRASWPAAVREAIRRRKAQGTV